MRYVGSCSSVNISKYYLFMRPAKVCVEQHCPKHAKDLVCHIAKWYFSIRLRYFLYIIPYMHIPVCTLAICIYCKLKCIHWICTLSTDYSYCLLDCLLHLICCVLTQCIVTSIHNSILLLSLTSFSLTSISGTSLPNNIDVGSKSDVPVSNKKLLSSNLNAPRAWLQDYADFCQ